MHQAFSDLKAGMSNFELKPIGFLESCFQDKFGTPRQPGLVPTSTARLRIKPDLQPEQALQGLESFSHVWLIFWFHLNQVSQYHAKVHPPRLGGKSLGLFATRTPHRPNPLGLSLVKLESIAGGELLFSGIDLVDGTPIMDIKPYIPEVESIPGASHGWTSSAETKNISVQFDPAAMSTLQEWQFLRPELNLQSLIIETIQLDPRPVLYRGFEGKTSPYRESHAIRLYDGDVHFRFISDTEVVVFKILLMK